MKITRLQLEKIIVEEIQKLYEQPDVSAASHTPNVGVPGVASVIRAEAREIEELDREIKSWTSVHEEIIEKAMELNADPRLLEYYRGDFEQLMTSMMDMLYQRYQIEGGQPR